MSKRKAKLPIGLDALNKALTLIPPLRLESDQPVDTSVEQPVDTKAKAVATEIIDNLAGDAVARADLAAQTGSVTMATDAAELAKLADQVTPAPAGAPTAAQRVGERLAKNSAAKWLAGALADSPKFTKADCAQIESCLVIRVQVKANPKRRGGALAFDCYRDGNTVEQFAAALAKANLGNETTAKQHVGWDFNHGFIRLERADAADQPIEGETLNA